METTTEIKNPPAVPKKRRVSYSQFSNWFNCPHRWYLDFVKGLRTYEDSIVTCFGTAIHEAVQLYIETLYKQGVKEADAIDMQAKFEEVFTRELTNAKVVHTHDEKMEFIVDGDNIIKAFTNMTNRIKHFPSNKYELIGIEDEIIMPIKHNVDFICYIDVVLKEKSTGRYRIIDIKTSRQGWNHYQKEDPAKIAQILLYKAFFSRKYNVSVDMIDVEFFILRRRLWENYAFPQSRIQTFVPKSNQKSVADTLNTFAQFITECFKPDGSFIEELKNYPKIPGKAKKHCKYCPHKKVNCDAKADVIDEE
jgi:hypothetical protein